MGKIYLLRHTRPEIPQGLCYGQSEVPLATSYAEELDAIGTRLPQLERIYSSPSLRCLRLAEDLHIGPVCIDERLKELSFGQWEGRLWNDIPRAESATWMEDFVHSAPPGGESYRQLWNRVLSFFDELRSLPRGDALLVTHGGIIRALRAWQEGHPLEEAFVQDLPFGCIYELGRIP